jgi:NADPH-dependent 2,4-dienoyl-CoA reductase/sulfur reductase-like enzyme
MLQVAPFFIIKSQVVPFFIVTWPPNLFSSDTFKGISGPDSDSKLAPNIIDKYTVQQYVETRAPRSVVIIGGGYIGMEMADALTRRGLTVTVVEHAAWVRALERS